jgi:glycosidase
MFTFPGAPSIYYGGEIGLSGGHDPENRRCMIWDKESQNHNLLNHIKKLIELRKQYPAFKLPDITWLETNDKLESIIFKKDKLYFIMSKRNIAQSIILPDELQYTTVEDIYNNKTLELSTSLEIDSYGFFIFRK